MGTFPGRLLEKHAWWTMETGVSPLVVGEIFHALGQGTENHL